MLKIYFNIISYEISWLVSRKTKRVQDHSKNSPKTKPKCHYRAVITQGL